MARNGSGTYSLPVAPFTPGTTISSSDENSDFSDIATALTDSIAADGQTPITGQLKGALGTAPTYSISGDLNTGFGSSTADTAFIQCGGANVISCTSTTATILALTVTNGISGTLAVTGAATFSGGAGSPVILSWNDAGAGTGPILDLFRDSASPAGADVLGSVDFNGRDSAANKQLYGRIGTLITSPTSTTETGVVYMQAIVAGALTTVLLSSGADIAIPGNLVVTGNITGKNTTVQRLTSGTAATYTATTGTVSQRVRMWGAGGGGGARTTNAGTNGTSSSFQVNGAGTAWTAVFGNGGAIAGAGGTGGTGGTDGSAGTLVDRASGADGGVSAMQVDATSDTQSAFTGGAGGASSRGGAGMPAATTGGSAKTNSGSGGAGGNSSVGTKGGGGGGAGEYVEFWVTGMTSATYTVGTKGTGGAAGGSAGGDGAAGIVIIEEFYS